MKYPTRNALLLASFLGAVTAQAQSSGRGEGGGGGDERAHLLSTGAGIASPSYATAFVENPAGIVYNTTTKIQASATSPNDDFDPLTFGGLVGMGNGSVGGGVGLFGTGTDHFSANWGLAATVADFALGFNGSKGLKGGGAPWGVDLGTIYNPQGETRVGAVAYGIVDGADAVGAGIAHDVSSATMAVDAARSINGKGTTVKPGLSVHAGNLAIAGGYGFAVDGNGGTPVETGVSLGLGYSSTGAFAVQFYYNQISEYHLGLTFRL